MLLRSLALALLVATPAAARSGRLICQPQWWAKCLTEKCREKDQAENLTFTLDFDKQTLTRCIPYFGKISCLDLKFRVSSTSKTAEFITVANPNLPTDTVVISLGDDPQYTRSIIDHDYVDVARGACSSVN